MRSLELSHVRSPAQMPTQGAFCCYFNQALALKSPSMSVIAILQQLTTKAPVLALREAARRGGFSERLLTKEPTDRDRGDGKFY